jgi:recombination protein RecA
MAAADNKRKALDIALASILKAHGEGAVMRLGEAKQLNVDVIPTGSLALDIALGVGGIPRGRITEIYGPESSGKTTICQHVVAQAQKRGGIAAYIDMEHALDPALCCPLRRERGRPADLATGHRRAGLRHRGAAHPVERG